MLLKLSRAAVTFLLCASMVLLSAQTEPAPKPFTKDDLVKLLAGNVPVKRVETLVRGRGIDFQITRETESDLRSAGADDTLLSTLRQLAPEPKPSIAPPPSSATLIVNSSVGGARVYVDDVAIGDTSSQGRLKIPSLTPGQHQVRVSLDGYEKFEDAVELRPAETVDLRVALKPNSQPPPTEAANSHAGAETLASVERLKVKAYVGGMGMKSGWMTISDKLQYQSDDGKHNIEFAVGDIEDVKKGAFGSRRGLIIIRLRNGKVYWIDDVDTEKRDTVLPAIHHAMAQSGKQ